MEKKLIWTLLPLKASYTTSPRGVLTPVLDLSLFLSPRLTPAGPSGTLAEFSFGGGDNFTSWVTLSTVRLSIGGVLLTGTLTSTPDPTLWPVLFPPTTPVRGFGYRDLSARRVLSYPVSTIDTTLRNTYTELATTTPEEFPGVLGNAPPGLATLFEALPQIQEYFGRTLTGRDTVLDTASDPRALIAEDRDDEIAAFLGLDAATATGRVGVAFFKAYGFYHRANRFNQAHDPNLPALARPKIPEFDFHEMVAALGDYPHLMRQLGLVLDYRVTLGAFADVPADDVAQLLTPASADAQTEHVRPVTAYLLDPDAPSFHAKPTAGSDLSAGMVNLSSPRRHVVTQIDVDGSALKTVQHTANIRTLALTRDAEASQQNLEQQRESVPSLRSDGVSVARITRKPQLTDRFAAQKGIHGAFTANTDAVLKATPLHADDVLRGYRVDVLDRAASPSWRSLCQRDGAYTTGDGTQEVADEGYVKAASATGEKTEPDLLFAHENLFSWSGWSLVAPRPGRTIVSPGEGEEVQDVTNTPQTAMDLEVGFKPTPKTLPRLRFGRTYRIRARSVDLAGNSLALDEGDASLATPEFTYVRYEPIQQPQLVQRAAVTEGESLEHMVIRSDRGTSAADYIVSAQVSDSAYAETNERHLAAPKATQFACEAHGAFDTLFDSDDPNSHRDSYLVAVKEAGTLLDRQVWDPESANYAAVNAVLVDGPSTPQDKQGVWPAKRGDELAPGQYVVFPDETLALPYLPDPMAMGLTLKEVGTGKLYFRSFAGSWPDLAPFRIVAREGSEADAEPRVEVNGETLDIFLPKAAIYTLRYSSLPDPDRLPEMAYWESIVGNVGAAQAALDGTHWMLSPYRELTLVHAVQHPLQDPTTAIEVDVAPGRIGGQTYTKLAGQVDFHGPSTAQVDLRAHWIDPEDELTRPGPINQRREAQLGSFRPDYADTSHNLVPGAPDELRHELGDTKHHRVVYQAVATTRFREYFPQALWQNEANITVQEPVFGEDGVELVKATVDVLATRRPDAPRVLYVVPTFKWETSEDGTRQTRLGGGLRVYLDRPWYSSGVGELLGVTFEPSVGSGENHRRFVSRWGSDPIRANTAPQNHLRPGHFENRVAVDSSVALPEKPELSVAVAGFAVEYSESRRLWYADLELNTGDAYFPFVRLSLCRFQPKSLPDLEISTTVLSEFAQVASDRIANVSRDGSQLSVSVAGVTGDNTDGSDTVDSPSEPDDLVVLPPASPTPHPGPPGVIAAPGIDDGPGFAINDVIQLPPQPAGDRALRHVVRARLEEKTGQSDLDWSRVDEEVNLNALWSPARPSEVVWSGQLQLPQAAVSTPGDFRVVFEEHELFWADDEVGAANGPVPPPENANGTTLLSPGLRASSRIVYLAIMTVPAGS